MVYLVEAFRSGHAGPAPDTAQRVRASALARHVVVLGRFVVPADEIEFWLFGAASREDVTATLAAAGIASNRISQVEDFVAVPSPEAAAL